MSQVETVARMAGSTARNALQRVQDIEETMQQVVFQFNQEITKINENTAVLVEMLGEDAFKTALKARRDRTEETTVSAQKKGVADAVAAGTLKPVDVVVDSSLLILTEKLVDGTAIPYGSRVQLPVGQIKEPLRSQFLGKKVGEAVNHDSGHLFEVTEIYEPQQAPAPVVPVVESLPEQVK